MTSKSLTQHAGLSPDRWAAFSLEQQVLMIGNEMQRATRLLGPGDRTLLQQCYERVLRLVDLTLEVNERSTLCLELIRWRDLIAALYSAPEPDPEVHTAAFRSLLLLTPESAQQIPYMATPDTPGKPRTGP